MLKSGTINVNNKRVTLNSFQLKPGDTVEVRKIEVKPSAGMLPFTVLYEDPYLIVIDKPAGISTSSIDGSRNAQEIISEYLKNQSQGKIRSYVVHRLDKEVSGVVLFAKSMDYMEKIKDNWEKTEKHYYALVEGTPEKEEDTIRSWIAEDRKQKVKSFQREMPESKLAITTYRTIRKLDLHTLLDVKTITGRKNQIRVHLSDMGNPIVGDRKYGASEDFLRRVRLHAYSLSFPHPVSGEIVKVESPMPKRFLKLKEEDEKYK